MVTVSLMREVQMSVHQIIDMISMRNGFMAAGRSMDVIRFMA